MKLIKFLVMCTFVTSCSDDDAKFDQTPPSFASTPIEINQVSSFIAFGETLTPTQKNPAIEYFTNQSNIPVRSVSNGIVIDIRLNANINDYEIWIKPTHNSQWLIIYDHVLNVDISIDEQINTGQILGTIGIGNRTELQINKIPDDIAYCPLTFGTDNFIQQHTNLSENWCVAETIIP